MPLLSSQLRRYFSGALALASLALLVGCRPKHVKVSSVPELGYPACDGKVPGEGTVFAQGHLRANPDALEPGVVERFHFSNRACLVVGSARQEWRFAATDVEAVFDANLTPLRVWKRQTVPGSTRPDGFADIRRYELRTPEVTIKHRKSDGTMEYEILRGPRPRAVITPGHGLLSAWIRRAHLQVGQKVREPVLDVREQVEVIRDITLRRDPDLARAWAPGGVVRVYTIYGRESVFTDQNDVVLGDLAGMQPSASLNSPEPPAVPMYGVADPVNTP